MAWFATGLILISMMTFDRAVDEINSVPGVTAFFMVMLVFFWLIRFVRSTEALNLW